MTTSALRRRRTAASAIVASCALALVAGCSGGADDPQTPTVEAKVSQDEFDKAMSTPTNLTFWTWVPDITDEVGMFMEKYPNIKVEVVNVGQGAAHYQKLRVAIKSGQGAPDVAQIEF